MKLYDVAKTNEVNVSLAPATESLDADEFFLDLGNKIFGWSSVGRVQEAIAAESLTFVDQKNSVLYNEYVSVLASRMGVDAPKTISLESLNENGQLTANYHLSLEGWMGDMWKKIKEIFENIYNKVKSFFNTYFTRLGRLKKSLENLQQVLGSTTKDMGDPGLQSPPDGLLKAFSGHTEVNANAVGETIASTKVLVATIAGLNKAAEGFAKDGILDADFVKNIKELKDKALKASQESAANREERAGTKMFGDKEKKKALDTENKSLQEIANTSEKKGNEMSSEVTSLGEVDAGTEEENRKKAQAGFDEFLKAVIDSFDKVKGKNLVGGKSVKSVSSDPEDGLKVEMDENVQASGSLVMSGKASLTDLVNSCIDLLKTAEADIKAYGNVNETIMKSFKTIDNLITDIDKIDPEKFGKYKKVINENVRHRLNLLRKFFTTYNKTCKNVFDMSLDVSDATVKYAVLSLKHFE